MPLDRRRFIATAAALGGLTFAPRLRAQSRFPQRPISLIDPFTAGSDTDYFARPLAAGMAQRLGQPVVVENKPGSGGAIGAEYVARARPDGHTLLLGSVSTLVANPAVNRNLRYDPLADLAPVTTIVTLPSATVVRADSPYRTLDDLLRAARARPGTISFASPGVGSAGHVLLEHFAHLAGVKFLHVPYKGGSALLTDLMGGQIDVASNNIASLFANLKNGKLRALAIRDRKRVAQLPDVPTFAELGFESVSQPLWFGLVTTAGTPDDIVVQLADTAQLVMRDPAYQEKITAVAGTYTPSTPAQFRSLVNDWLGQFRETVRQANITLE